MATMSPSLCVKPLPGCVAVFDRREQRAQEEHEAVGVLVRRDRLRHQVERVAADLAIELCRAAR